MAEQVTRRIGFACKRLDPDQNQSSRILREKQAPYLDRGTTAAWCRRQPRAEAEARLLECVDHNMGAMLRLVEWVGSLHPQRRMVRLGSSQLPLATHPDWSYLWRDPINRAWMEQGFGKVGDAARRLDVRLSFHPGQFCCIVSDRPDVVDRTIEELEYHADMIRWMGYGVKFQDFKCNIHLSGRLGADAFESAYLRLSPELQNTLTIENDEFGAGLDDVMPVSKWVPIVLDLHHHLIRDEEYIGIDDPRVQQIQNSWWGVRPVIHYSYFRNEHLPVGTDDDQLPSMKWLLRHGGKKQKLRAHSDCYPNRAANNWALSFWPLADIMCEAKHKNLASQQLWEQAQ